MLFHKLGVDTSVSRQYLQTAVALIRSFSDTLNVEMRERISGGSRLTGASEFLARRRFIEMDGNLSIARSN